MWQKQMQLEDGELSVSKKLDQPADAKRGRLKNANGNESEVMWPWRSPYPET
jgi:hypothetical protein